MGRPWRSGGRAAPTPPIVVEDRRPTPPSATGRRRSAAASLIRRSTSAVSVRIQRAEPTCTSETPRCVARIREPRVRASADDSWRYSHLISRRHSIRRRFSNALCVARSEILDKEQLDGIRDSRSTVAVDRWEGHRESNAKSSRSLDAAFWLHVHAFISRFRSLGSVTASSRGRSSVLASPAPWRRASIW